MLNSCILFFKYVSYYNSHILKINDQIVDPVHEGADGENIQKNIGCLGKTVCIDDYNTSVFRDSRILTAIYEKIVIISCA